MKPCVYPRHAHPSGMDRRQFIRTAGLAAAGLAVAGCQPKVPDVVSKENAKAVVAIAKANSYDPKLVKKQVQAMLDGIGGLSDILAHGNRVAIKINLTGGTSSAPLPGIPAIESYLTHPQVVKALIELLRDSNVTNISIVEAVYEEASWPAYGYDQVSKDTGAALIDLNNPTPYKDFVSLAATTTKPTHDSYFFHPLLTEIDAFISVSKMKCHNTAGVTHTMKNLFGTAPLHKYQLNSGDTYRSEFHGPSATTAKTRVPNIIVDINKLRPVTLSVIDGIWTSEAGEGPWVSAMTPIKPNLLFAGKDPVATDSVASAAMGFDPTADYPNEPFVNGVNHLAIAAAQGLGTNNLDEISVIGESIKDVTMKFKASY
jgi:uncharacterized protein (DUF362 family)